MNTRGPLVHAYGFEGSVVKGPLRALVNVYFMHKGVMVKPS